MTTPPTHSTRRRKIYLLALPIAIVVLGVLLLIGKSCGTRNATEKRIEIGALLPLTGNFGALGNWFKTGFLLAERQINLSHPPLKVRVYLEDNRSDVSTTVSAYRKLVNVQNVRIVATTTSPACLALKPLALQDKILLFANAAHPAITEPSDPLVFRHSSTIPQESDLISTYIRTKSLDQQNSRWAILFLNNEFGLAFRDRLQRVLGPIVVFSDSYEANQSDFKSLAAKVLAQRPLSGVVVVGFTQNLGLLIRSIREREFSGILVSNFGFTTPSVTQVAGDAAKGVFYVDYAYPMNRPDLSQLRDMALKEFKTDLTPVGLLAYHTVQLVAKAGAMTGSSEPLQIANWIRSQQTIVFNGLTLTITKAGDILPPMEIKRFE